MDRGRLRRVGGGLFIALGFMGLAWFWIAVLQTEVVGSRSQCQNDNPGKTCRIVWEPSP